MKRVTVNEESDGKFSHFYLRKMRKKETLPDALFMSFPLFVGNHPFSSPYNLVSGEEDCKGHCFPRIIFVFLADFLNSACVSMYINQNYSQVTFPFLSLSFTYG